VLHVLDVATARTSKPPIDRCRYSSLAWLPGGEEFVVVRMVAEDEVEPGRQPFHRRIWRHRIGTPTSADELLDGPGLYADHTYYGVRASRDGRWLVVTGNIGTARRDSVWIAELGATTSALAPVLTQADDVQCNAWVDRDGRLYLHTTDGAPRWRLAVADPAAPTREHWRELVAEDPGSVLQAVRRLEPAEGTGTGTGGALLVLARARHAVSEVALHAADDGRPVGSVPLPGPGTLTGLTVADRDTPDRAGQLWLGWTDIVTPPQVHRFELATGQTVLESAAPGAVTVRRCAPSSAASPPPTAPPCGCSWSPRPARSPPAPPWSPATAGSPSAASPPTPRPRWPGWPPAAATRWCRCAAAARRASSGTWPATAPTSRTCSTTCTRRPGR
jgi:prolyl oligopeptidase